jgi:hypothetical protein
MQPDFEITAGLRADELLVRTRPGATITHDEAITLEHSPVRSGLSAASTTPDGVYHGAIGEISLLGSLRVSHPENYRWEVE